MQTKLPLEALQSILENQFRPQLLCFQSRFLLASLGRQRTMTQVLGARHSHEELDGVPGTQLSLGSHGLWGVNQQMEGIFPFHPFCHLPFNKIIRP